MNETTDTNTMNIIIPLMCIVFGWFLGETTSLFKKRWTIWNLKKSLLLEIKDCLSWLLRNQITLEYMIQLTVLGAFVDSGPVEVPTHIFDKHFPEISPHLTRHERTSYNSIYNLIRSSQKDSIRVVELIRNCAKGKTRTSEFSGILEAVYYNTSLAIYQIQYHIDHHKDLNIDKVTGEDAARIDKSIGKRIKDLVIEAKKIGLDEVSRRHNQT